MTRILKIHRRILPSMLLCLLLPSFAHAGGLWQQAEGAWNQWQQATGAAGTMSVAGLSQSEMVAGLKEALRVGTQSVVSRLSLRDAFLADRSIHIPLPSSLERARSLLANIGMSGALDDLERRINRAAEQATPQAKKLFLDSIRKMSLNDARSILRGPDDAATRYFQRTMTPGLRKAIAPLIQQSLERAGAVRAYDQLMARYQSIPMVPNLKSDLRDHAVDGTLRGIFHYLAKEEKAIRRDPAKRTTALLRKVFGH